jgi:hypothetical protein
MSQIITAAASNKADKAAVAAQAIKGHRGFLVAWLDAMLDGHEGTEADCKAAAQSLKSEGAHSLSRLGNLCHAVIAMCDEAGEMVSRLASADGSATRAAWAFHAKLDKARSAANDGLRQVNRLTDCGGDPQTMLIVVAQLRAA